MKLRIKKHTNRVNEEDVGAATITDPSLVDKAQQLQNDKQKIQDEFNKAQTIFNKAQEKYNKEIKKVNDKYAQLLKKQEALNKSNPQQGQHESFKVKVGNRLFESASKKDLLVDAITYVLSENDESFSYDLSSEEIKRLARKINDYLTENKEKEILWDDVRYVIKKYLIKHNTISFSQTEVNLFNDLLDAELLTHKEFEKYF